LEILHADDEHTESWREVWRRKGRAASGRSSYVVGDLFAADGFDGSMAQTDAVAQSHIRRLIVENLRIEPGMRVLEAGCGAGAVLSLLVDTGATLTGVDYSEPHIAVAGKVLPGVDLRVGEAAVLPFDAAVFDAVFSYGVFLYFADLAYAARVLAEMVRVGHPGAPLLIMDIPDEATRAECEAARHEAGASMKPPHRYYPRAFFERFAAEHARSCRVFDQQVPGYGNSRFRFNALLQD
jgi:ubiquinone/menaquinone biosynthesis C-methylase UbiE